MDTRDEAVRGAVDSYRRRSPGAYDRRQRGPRARSRSPPNIDSYKPDRSRDDFYRARDGREEAPRRRASPPPVQAGIDRYVPGHDPPAMTNNPMQNPMNMDQQVSFSYFAEWWRYDHMVKEERERQKTGARRPERVKSEKESREERSKEREQIQAAYDSYREKLQEQTARAFVQQHKHDEWFKERYLPDVRGPFRERLLENRRQDYHRWLADIESGTFDEFTLEGIYKNESNGAGGIVEKEEGEATAANEILGVGDLLPTRGGDIRDDAISQPTLLIKTIAPTVSREKMEAFCKEHLGEGEGGYKYLSLSDPNPNKKFHRIGWVVLQEVTTEPMQINDRGDGRDEEDDEGAIRSDAEGPTAQSTAAKALDAINGKTVKDGDRGDFVCHVGIHEPPSGPRKKALWDLFSAPERIDRDLNLAIRLVRKLDGDIGDEFDGEGKIEQHVELLRAKGWLQPPVSAVSVKKLDPDDMDEDEGAIEEGEDVGYDDEIDDEDLLAKKKRLDLMVEYLRRVHNFCLFCVFECDSVHELTRKCPSGHLRRPRSSLTSAAKVAAKASASAQPFPFRKSDTDGHDANRDEKKPKMSVKTQQQLQRAFNWVKTYEEKLLQILDPDSVDIKKLGGKPLEEGLEEELSKFVKEEDENKWRCKAPDCSKLFKGSNFWRKHVEKRHVEFFQKIKDEVNLLNAYVMDPSHITAARTDLQGNGHFSGSASMSSGPRGMNLANMPLNFPNVGAGVPHAVQMQMAAWIAQQTHMGGPPFAGAEDDRHGPGPVRRMGGGQRYNARPGPYDRPNKDGRGGAGGRWNGGAGVSNLPGRLTPPRNSGGRPPTGGRFGEGGVANLGPKEAVQGRSLKSYEDLDAAGGADEAAGLDY